MAFTKVAPAGIGSTPGEGYRIGDSFLHSTGVDITNINATGIVTATNIKLPDSSDTTNGRIIFGATTDMMLFHYGGANYIDVTSNLNIRGSSSGNTIKIRPKQSEEGIKIVPDGAVELYHNNQKKIETFATGANVIGNLDVINGHVYINDNYKAYFGTGNDLELFHDGSHNYILGATGDLILKNSTANYFKGVTSSGAAELYYNGNKKFETTNTGVTVTGTVAATSYTGDGSNLTGTQTTINNNANDRIITGSGTANTLEGEQNLIASAPSSGTGYVELKHGSSSGDYGYFQIRSGSTLRGRIGSNSQVDAIAIDTAGGSSTKILFKTGSSQTEKVSIDSSGMLHISDRNSGNTGDHFFQAGAFGIRMQDTGGFNRWNIERNYGGFQSTPLIHLSAQGRVGVNVNDPSHTLDVVGAADALGIYRNDYTGSGGAGLNLHFGRAKADGSLFNCARIAAVGSDNTGQAGEFRFSTLRSGSLEEALRITSGGDVGINVTPISGVKLQVGTPNSTTGVFRAHPNYFSIDSGYANGGSTGGVVGSASNAALIFGGDADTGLYHSASDTLNFTTGGTERLRIKSDGSLRSFTAENGVACFSNNDHGNVDFNHRGNRVLHSNAYGWDGNGSGDGADPILVLAVENRAGNSDIGDAYGLALHSESQDDNDYGPLIGWTNRSNSGNYNTTYAAILGKKTGQAVDTNWSAGELHFHTNKPAGFYADPPGTFPTQNSSGYMNQNPDLRITAEGYVATHRQPAFAAYGSGGWTNMTNTKLEFGNLGTGFGGDFLIRNDNYSTSNSRFTAPITGIYHFTLALYLNTNNTTDIKSICPRINGSEMSNGNDKIFFFGFRDTSTGAIDGNTVSGSLTIRMAKDDYIEVWGRSNISQTWSYYGYHSHFMGFLIG